MIIAKLAIDFIVLAILLALMWVSFAFLGVFIAGSVALLVKLFSQEAAEKVLGSSTQIGTAIWALFSIALLLEFLFSIVTKGPQLAHDLFWF